MLSEPALTRLLLSRRSPSDGPNDHARSGRHQVLPTRVVRNRTASIGPISHVVLKPSMRTAPHGGPPHGDRIPTVHGDRLRSPGRSATATDAASTRGAYRDYLTIIGFLRKYDDHYELMPEAEAFPLPSPAYLGAPRSSVAPLLRECFQNLTAAVRRGGTATSDEGTFRR